VLDDASLMQQGEPDSWANVRTAFVQHEGRLIDDAADDSTATVLTTEVDRRHNCISRR